MLALSSAWPAVSILCSLGSSPRDSLSQAVQGSAQLTVNINHRGGEDVLKLGLRMALKSGCQSPSVRLRAGWVMRVPGLCSHPIWADLRVARDDGELSASLAMSSG